MLVSKNTILTYKNERGLSMNLAPLTDFFLLTCDETIQNDMNSQKLRYLDGENFDNATLGIRHIDIFGFFRSVTNISQMERTLKRIFNLGLAGELTFKNRFGYIFNIDCRLDDMPDVAFNITTLRTEFSISLTCFNPYWRGRSTTQHISTINKLGRFPLVIPKKEKFVFGYRANTLKTTFDNIGDAKTGAVYQLKADGGTVTNPSITHENSGRSVKVFTILYDQEKILVTSFPDFVGIEIHREDGSVSNGMPYLSDETKRQFFMLDFGENTISYYAEENVTNLSVSAMYTPLYLGAFDAK